jgi:hypothetical protein
MEIDTHSAREFSIPGMSSASRNTPLNGTLDNAQRTMSEENEKTIAVGGPAIDGQVIDGHESLGGFAANGFEDEDEDDQDVVTPYQKRKRMSVRGVEYNELFDSGMSPTGEPFAKRSKPFKEMRGVIVGVWRDSDQPEDARKHVIHAFIDIHERLRTRIYPIDRDGKELIGNIPTGPGGCWVTFPRIIFDSHLKSLSSPEIKEYVRIRTDAKPEPSAEARHEAEKNAVLKAVSVVATQEAASPGHPMTSPHSRQPRNQTPKFKAVNASNTQTPKSSPFNDAKPTGVLLGFWSESDQPRDIDKHAVYGVLGGNDCFRVKVQRITRDGRFVDGNYPIGAGALWLHYDKMVLEPHLASLNRAEIKEYVRIRQKDLENRESEKDRRSNELKAIKDAKTLVTTEVRATGVDPNRTSPEVEARHSARSVSRTTMRAQADAEARAERIRQGNKDTRERANEMTRKEVAKAEAEQQKTERAEAALKEAAQAELKANLKKMNKVWVAQQSATLPKDAGEEIKYHNGIKYERKQGGPFQGKLTSAGALLIIDGEEYVEYRVLTKPSFF